MAFEQSYPLFNLGPRADLNFAYLNAVLNGTGVAVTSTETSAGFSISRASQGVYTITFPKCKFVQISARYMPVALAGNLFATILAGIDPTTGTATLNITSAVAATLADPTAAANELELQFLLGF